MTLKELLSRTICMICEYWMPLKFKESEYKGSVDREGTGRTKEPEEKTWGDNMHKTDTKR